MNNNIEKLVSSYVYWPELEHKFQKNINFSQNSIVNITKKALNTIKIKPKPVASDIIAFYATNQYLSEKRQANNDVLTKKDVLIYKQYANHINSFSEKMFYYILCISIGEARHCYDDYKEVHKKLKKKDYYDENVSIALKSIMSYSSGRNSLIKKSLLLLDENKNVTIDDTLKAIYGIFDVGNFSKGFGGKPWRDIIHLAGKFASGEINAEVFLDQSFSLEHNSGSMFNKDIVFSESEYLDLVDESVDENRFLLNIQHAGQMLDFLKLDNIKKLHTYKIYEDNYYNSYIAIRNIIKMVKKYKPQNTNDLLDDKPSNFDVKEVFSYNSSGKKKSLSGYQLKQVNIMTELLSDKIKQKITLPAVSKNYYEVLDTNNIKKAQNKKEILGGKAFGLAQMNKMSLPVPKAIVWTCQNSISYAQDGHSWSKKLHSQMNDINSFNLDSIGNPVMVSIRSGAPVSMPGMMDTILNVGIDNTTYDYFKQKLGSNTADDCAVRFIKLFSKSFLNYDSKWPKNLSSASLKFRKLLDNYNNSQAKKNKILLEKGLFPLSKEQQISLSIQSVFKSWNSERAVAYRNHQGLSNEMGTAAIMQHMVLGNLNSKSCTGVLFSRDCINGKKGMIGEFLVSGQGEEVVSGEVTPQNINEMKKWNLNAYKKLEEIATMLEEKTGQIQDIEFTIEDGNVYILQCRSAVSSNIAKKALLDEKFAENKISRQDYLSSLNIPDLVSGEMVKTDKKPNFTGLSASPGVITGICIKDEKDYEKYKNKGKKLILISPETKPEHAPLMMKCDGFLTQHGGFTSHAAILARSWNKPCIVGSETSNKLNSGSVITMDAKNGHVWYSQLEIQEVNDNELKDFVLDSVKVLENKNIKNINNELAWYELKHSVEIQPKIKNYNKFLELGNLMKINLAFKHSAGLKAGLH